MHGEAHWQYTERIEADDDTGVLTLRIPIDRQTLSRRIADPRGWAGPAVMPAPL
ncbi:hypothetical protein [Streptomyces goshikiensis]|uniref:hypothetical protein n=1 Tax=Streptomyces goshikiensis TaxID=1942 RepID=UPI003326F81D